MRLSNEATTEQLRDSATPRYVKPQTLDQLEEWMKEKPIPYICNDKFSQEDIFHYWSGRLSGHTHVNQTYPDVVRMWRQFHGCPASGSGIERVSFQLENSMMLSRKILWTRPWKPHSRHQCQEVVRSKGAKSVVVIWAYSVALVWLF